MSPFFKTTSEILLATDFCGPSRRALACAKEIARLRGNQIRALHVIDLTGEPPSRTPSFSAARDSAERMLREIRRELRLAGIRESATLITAGKPAQAIREAAIQYHAGLLVLGLNGSRSRRTSNLGRTARALLLQPPCPILTVAAANGEQSPGDLSKPIFVTDATPEALQAALGAWALPDRARAVSLCVVPPAGRRPPRPALPSELQGYFAPPTTYEGDDAAENIQRAAAEAGANLIVLALRTGGSLDSFQRGGIAHALITVGSCPVLTVRT